jgi:Acetyl-CoA acetyltransferase
MPTGIRDKVAIIGMGCTRFGERWDVGAEDLMVEAFEEALADAGIDRKEIQAAWLGTCFEEISVGKSALPLSITLRLPRIPVTRVENFCATGTEASGARIRGRVGRMRHRAGPGGGETQRRGLRGTPQPGGHGGEPELAVDAQHHRAGGLRPVGHRLRRQYHIPMEDLKRAMAHVSVKSHANGSLNPKAHLRRPVTEDEVLNAPIVAYPLGLFDCCGVSDGAACAMVTTPEIARGLGKKDIVTVKALQIALSSGEEMGYNEWDGTYFMTTAKCSKAAYQEAGITDPRREISMMEVHDCFSITELVTMEDLHISERGKAWKDVLDGFFDLRGGGIPCQPDGGLKCFGHPIGASGLRMLYEMYLQLLGRAGERQIPNPRYGLTHNLGGMPHMNICAITIVGRYGD